MSEPTESRELKQRAVVAGPELVVIVDLDGEKLYGFMATIFGEEDEDDEPERPEPPVRTE